MCSKLSFGGLFNLRDFALENVFKTKSCWFKINVYPFLVIGRLKKLTPISQSISQQNELFQEANFISAMSDCLSATEPQTSLKKNILYMYVNMYVNAFYVSWKIQYYLDNEQISE